MQSVMRLLRGAKFAVAVAAALSIAACANKTNQLGGQFAIGVIGPDGQGERILTEGFHNEGPTFAPNGRVLMFFRDPGGNAGPALYTIDLTGRNEQKVPTPSYASDPAWSPLLS